MNSTNCTSFVAALRRFTVRRLPVVVPQVWAPSTPGTAAGPSSAPKASRKFMPALVAVLLTAAIAAGVQALPRFGISRTQVLDPGGQVAILAEGDFNQDGQMDLATMTGSPARVMTFANNGSGSFAPAVGASYAALSGARGGGCAAGDFNGDGHLDLASALGSSTGNPNGFGNQVIVSFGDGTGQLTPTTQFTTGGSSVQVESGDFNEDGHADLIIACMDDASVRLHLGAGTGLFSSGGTIISSGFSLNLMTVADVDGDRHQDIVYAGGNSVRILLGNGSGGFAGTVETLTTTTARGSALGDLDRDGDADLVVTADQRIFVLRNEGAGDFTLIQNVPLPGVVFYEAVMGDFDQDGHVDAAAAAYWVLGVAPDQRIALLPGDGSGQLGTAEYIATGQGSVGIVAADFNSDGAPDLATADSESYTVSILLNQPVILAPTGLTCTALSSTKVRLTWTDRAGNEQGYLIERKTGVGSFGRIQRVGPNVTSWDNAFLTPGTTHTYRVRAYRGTARSDYSQSVPVTTPGLPGTPSNMTATVLTSTRVALSWTDGSSDEQGFKIERKTGAGSFGQIHRVGPGVTSYLNGFLTPGTEYTYRVRAHRGPDHSGYATSSPVTTLPLPGVPAGVSAAATSRTRVVITWTDTAVDETGFKIEKKTGSGAFVHIVSVGPNVTSYTNSFLTPNTRYTYRVRAYRGPDNSAYGTSGEVTTPP